MFGRERLEAIVGSLEPGDAATTVLERVVAEADETTDDMAVLMLRPASGAAVLSPRVEIMELDSEDLESGFAERFLEACDVSADDLAASLSQARDAVEAHGLALLEITTSGGQGRARVLAADAAERATPA
jgi:hypothetical protein